MAREGSRWIGEPPTSDEFADWFKKAVPLHDGMDPERYVGGVTLIPAKEKRQVEQRKGNAVQIVDQYRMTFTPYAKVETRLAYFWDLCAKNGWLGEISPVIPDTAMREFNSMQVGEPFYLAPYMREDGRMGLQRACTMRVRIYDPERGGKHGGVVMLPPAGTKVGAFSSDLNSALRVETGAVGRALGMAGMLVIPGSGVATAEDMHELAGQTDALPDNSEPTLPAAPGGGGGAAAAADPSLEQRAAELRLRIESDFPGIADELEAWAQERSININEPKDTQLRALVKQMEKKLKEAGAE